MVRGLRRVLVGALVVAAIAAAASDGERPGTATPVRRAAPGDTVSGRWDRLARKCLVGDWKLSAWQETASTGYWQLLDATQAQDVTLTQVTPQHDRLLVAVLGDGTGTAEWDVTLSGKAGGHTYGVHLFGHAAFSYEIDFPGGWATPTSGDVHEEWFLDGRVVPPNTVAVAPAPFSFECGTSLAANSGTDQILLDRGATPPSQVTSL